MDYCFVCKAILHQIAEKAIDDRKDVMTIAEQLEAKGYQLGRQDGVKEATRQLARQLLSDGVARENIKRYTSLSDSELDKL